jgi:hypothetical protein
VQFESDHMHSDDRLASARWSVLPSVHPLHYRPNVGYGWVTLVDKYRCPAVRASEVKAFISADCA